MSPARPRDVQKSSANPYQVAFGTRIEFVNLNSEVPVWQDEKAAVIDNQLQAVILMAQVPTDPAIPCSALQGRGGKAQKGYPLIAPSGDVPKRLADLGQRTQVMMLLHQFLVMLLFEWANGPDKNLPQVQGSSPHMKHDSDFYIPHWESVVQKTL